MKLRVVATLVACLIPWFYADTSAAQIVEAALDDGETLLPEAGRIIAQGTGYQLIETDPSLTDGDSVTDESDEIVRMPPGPRRVWVFNSWQGVQNAPIPAELKADMAEEYTNVPFDAEDEGGEWLMDEAAALEAMAAVEETPPPTTRPGNPSEPRQLPFGLCSKKKKPGSKNKTINLSPSIIEREVAGGKIRANLNQSGQISATVFFTKKSRCGIPYSVKVDRVEITGVLDLPGSEIGYQGTIQSSLPALSFKLFEFVQHISFYVGPIRIVLAPSVRGDFALKLSSEVQISAGVRAPFNGRYSFGYSCTKSGCVELRPFENFFETAPEPGQLLGSISARVIATPSVNIVARVDGFIYVKKLRFFRGDLGVNLAVPAEV